MLPDVAESVSVAPHAGGLQASLDDGQAPMVLSMKAVKASKRLSSILEGKEGSGSVNVEVKPSHFRAWHDFAEGRGLDATAPTEPHRHVDLILVRNRQC